MNALRLNAGFTPALFTARTGLPWSAVAGRLDELQAEGWLETVDGAWRASERGARHLDALLARFLP